MADPALAETLDRFRSYQQIAAFAEGLDVVEPGIVSTAEWRPEPGAHPLPAREDTAGWCLVTQKPGSRSRGHSRASLGTSRGAP
jgi:hypothetical protein